MTQTKQINLLNYKEVAVRLSCSVRSLGRLADKGLLRRQYYPGIGYRWTEYEVDRYIREAGVGRFYPPVREVRKTR